MFALTSSHEFFLYSLPADMRMGFDILCETVMNKLQTDPRRGQVFVFINRRRDHIKLLHWENGGFVLYHKRLEAGTFELPKSVGDSCKISLDWASLVMLVEGVSTGKIERRKRYQLPSKN